VAASTSTASSTVRPRAIRSGAAQEVTAPELARVLSNTETGTAGAPPIAVAAVVVQTSLADAAALADLATRLAEDVRGLLQADLPSVPVSTAVAVASPERETAAGPAPAPRSADVIVVDRDRRVATVAGQPLDLTYREFELLAFLVEHPGRVFSRAQLLRTVWDQAEVGSRTVDVHVRRLRVKLGDEAGRLTTVRNVGYRLEPGADSQVPAPLETVA
jgi:DNA-binding CsgD family transcriptional regulator